MRSAPTMVTATPSVSAGMVAMVVHVILGADRIPDQPRDFAAECGESLIAPSVTSWPKV